MTAIKPTSILKKFFGLKDGQENMEFIAEMRELREDEASYKEVVELAAQELGVEIDWSD